ncbi:MAG: hypothetical protein ACE5K0_05290 [Candidatus Methanofastidiosia archaeon]
MKNKNKIAIGILALSLILSVQGLSADPHGKGCLVAHGIGRALLEGSGEVTIFGRGMLVVQDFGEQDARIWTDGRGHVRSFGNISIYKGTGFARVSGSQIIVEIRTFGNEAWVKACGKGFTVLEGEGAFRTWKG